MKDKSRIEHFPSFSGRLSIPNTESCSTEEVIDRLGNVSSCNFRITGFFIIGTGCGGGGGT